MNEAMQSSSRTRADGLLKRRKHPGKRRLTKPRCHTRSALKLQANDETHAFHGKIFGGRLCPEPYGRAKLKIREACDKKKSPIALERMFPCDQATREAKRNVMTWSANAARSGVEIGWVPRKLSLDNLSRGYLSWSISALWM